MVSAFAWGPVHLDSGRADLCIMTQAATASGCALSGSMQSRPIMGQQQRNTGMSIPGQTPSTACILDSCCHAKQECRPCSHHLLLQRHPTPCALNIPACPWQALNRLSVTILAGFMHILKSPNLQRSHLEHLAGTLTIGGSHNRGVQVQEALAREERVGCISQSAPDASHTPDGLGSGPEVGYFAQVLHALLLFGQGVLASIAGGQPEHVCGLHLHPLQANGGEELCEVGVRGCGVCISDK